MIFTAKIYKITSTQKVNQTNDSMSTKHQTFTPVFRFTPFFQIYRGKFTVVKSTLARRKFTAVRYKKWRKFWCIAKKWSKKT